MPPLWRGWLRRLGEADLVCGDHELWTEALLAGLLESHRTAGEFVGARIAFRDRNGAVTEAAAGTDTIGPNAKQVSLDVPRGIGSITKVFVAVSVLQLVDEGRSGTRVWSPGELVAIADARGRVGTPGSGHHYSNTNYILLGEIIQQVTGNSWLDEVTARIIEPLGMRSTRIIEPGNVAVGHSLVDATFEVKVPLDPSTGGSAGALR